MSKGRSRELYPPTVFQSLYRALIVPRIYLVTFWETSYYPEFIDEKQ